MSWHNYSSRGKLPTHVPCGFSPTTKKGSIHKAHLVILKHFQSRPANWHTGGTNVSRGQETTKCRARTTDTTIRDMGARTELCTWYTVQELPLSACFNTYKGLFNQICHTGKRQATPSSPSPSLAPGGRAVAVLQKQIWPGFCQFWLNNLHEATVLIRACLHLPRQPASGVSSCRAPSGWFQHQLLRAAPSLRCAVLHTAAPFRYSSVHSQWSPQVQCKAEQTSRSSGLPPAAHWQHCGTNVLFIPKICMENIKQLLF